MTVRILIGDCRERLRELPDASVDSVVCDPPYHLTSIVKRFGSENAAPAKSNGATGVYGRASKGFMGQTWDGGDVAFNPETWAEVLRVLKPGGHLVAFSGTRTYHRMVCAIEDAGFEIRDQLAWVYGSGFPKSLDVSKQIDKAAGAEREYLGEGPFAARKPRTYSGGNSLNISQNDPRIGHPLTAPATDAAREWQGWGTALKPSWEPICLARKPLIGTVAANVLAHGTGALNIDGCRIEAAADYHELSVTQGGDHFSIGSSEKTRGTTFKPAEGRWPANLCHDGSEEVLAGFPAEAGSNSLNRGRGENEGALGKAFGRARTQVAYDTRETGGSAARFFYCAKATTEERGEGNNHPTVKPVALMRWLVRLVTPKGGLVLDPFMGSGSTALACDAEQFDFIGCELSPEYAAIAEQRIRDAAGMFADIRKEAA